MEKGVDIRDERNPGLGNGDTIGAFRIKRIVELKDAESYAYELEHQATGARYFHISTKDTENTFSVAFKTVPFDSTGVAHILEHTVLCGSRKYPVRDPFFSMLKRSLSSFMNAFTASDWTMYPFSTQNPKDFYNLMEVYLDAAFFPNLDELSFKQEGHRLESVEISGAPDSLTLQYKGVVYNEMKGAMSSPREVLARSLMNAMYPSTTYRHNSGGDPAEIPKLTHDQLKSFHRRFYHPSNAYFYTYGDLALKDHLQFVQDRVLCRFERIDPGTEVPLQPRWSEPQTATYRYPLGKTEDASKKSQVCAAWLMADIRDTFEVLILTLLELILLGNSASPLRKALIDSGLGTALSDRTGFDADQRDTLFACGLKGVEASDARKIEAIVFDVIENLATNGIDKPLIESAIHQMEFQRKEVTNHPYPYGIKRLLTFCAGWFHGGDPVRILNFDEDMERIRKASLETSFLEDKLKIYFLENPHRLLFSLVPDQQMEEKENRRVEDELRQVMQGVTEADLEKIKRDARALKALQESVEDASCLPTLALEDIPPAVHRVAENRSYPDAAAAWYQQPTSGIFYFLMASGTGHLPRELIPLVPFFCYSLSRVGTVRRDYVEMARLLDTYTGGISLSSHARTGFADLEGCASFVAFSGKCLTRNQDKMFDLIQELLHTFEYSDTVRLKRLLLEYRAALESGVVQNGHRLAMSLASRNFSTSCSLSEDWHGIHQLLSIKELTEDLTDEKLNSISKNLTSIGKTILSSSNCRMAMVGEESSLRHAVPFPDAVRSGFEPARDPVESTSKAFEGFVCSDIPTGGGVPREGWSTSSAVSFVARAFETVRMGHRDAPALSVISKMLRSIYLHREIREKGGAYGGFATYNPGEGLFCFASYRDPHIVSTLKVYDDAFSFIRSGKYTEQDIHEAILQVCSEIDKPDPPAAAARRAFHRRIISLSDELREAFKRSLLSLTRTRVMDVAQTYFSPEKSRQAIAVISSEEKLKVANDRLSDNPLVLKRI
jgi:Zn-dependent M16 (insulinase) family peptidase